MTLFKKRILNGGTSDVSTILFSKVNIGFRVKIVVWMMEVKVGAVDEALIVRRFISWRVNRGFAGWRTAHVMKIAKPTRTIKANGVIHFQYLRSQPKQPPLG
nr:hypothetical protein [Tanacetum cinerariifolium]